MEVFGTKYILMSISQYLNFYHWLITVGFLLSNQACTEMFHCILQYPGIRSHHCHHHQAMFQTQGILMLLPAETHLQWSLLTATAQFIPWQYKFSKLSVSTILFLSDILTYPDKYREEAECYAGSNSVVTIVSPGVRTQTPLVGQAAEWDQVQPSKEPREYQVSKHKLFHVVSVGQ